MTAQYKLSCDNVAAIMERLEDTGHDQFIKTPEANCARFMAQEFRKNATADVSIEDLLNEIEDRVFRNMVRDELAKN